MRWFRGIILVFISFSSLNAQRVLKVKENHVLIDRDYGIGKIGDYVTIWRKSDRKIVSIGVGKLLRFQDGKAAAEIIRVLENYGISTGDSVSIAAVNRDSAPESQASEEEPDLLVSNVFYETDLRQALDDLAAQSGISIVADNTVQGFVTMEIDELPLEKALSRILSTGGYTFKKMEGFYLVGLADPSNPSFNLLSVTENIPVNYMTAANAAELLSDYYKPYVKANIILNCITVTASSEIINKIKNDLNNIDIPPKQVMIEALVTEVKSGVLKSIGIDWSLFGTTGDKNLSTGANLSVGLLDSANAMFNINRKELGLMIGGMSFQLITTLRALAQDGKAEIKANPRVITTNAQPAIIDIAKEQYFSVVTGPVNYPYTRLEKVSSGIKLEITPFISESGEITVKILPHVSDAIGYGRQGLPIIDSRMVSTTVRVKDGQTITIGGLTQENMRREQNKIPILGSIPILGYLFSHTKYVKEKTDIIIFITPRIITE